MRKRIALLLFLLAAGLLVLLVAGIRQSRLFRVDLSNHGVNGTLTGQLPLGQGPNADVSASKLDTLLIMPHYTASDPTGRRWDITADRADQAGMISGTTAISVTTVSGTQVKHKAPTLIGGTGHVLLYTVSGTFVDPTLKPIKGVMPPPETMKSDQADYLQLINRLTLIKNVVITGRGLTLTTPAATAYLVSHTAVGDEGVTIRGVIGKKGADGLGQGGHGGYDVTLIGDHFTIDQAAGHVTLIGNVWAHLVPQL